jgi:hypothetical protein
MMYNRYLVATPEDLNMVKKLYGWNLLRCLLNPEKVAVFSDTWHKVCVPAQKATASDPPRLFRRFLKQATVRHRLFENTPRRPFAAGATLGLCDSA